MHKSVLIENIGTIKKQRNMFLFASTILLVSNILMCFVVATKDQKLVMVPALKSEMIISNGGVSRTYLEEMSLLFLSNLLDLSPSDIQHKKELIFKYSSNSNPKALQKLVEYFTKCTQDYKRFNLTTYFSVKNLEIDLKNLSVIAHGILTSHYGKAGYETESEDYLLEFEWQGSHLRLKSFSRILTEEKRARDRAKSLKYEEDIKDEFQQNTLNDMDLDEPAETLNSRINNDYDDDGEVQ